jgi:hypothetical protein
LSKIQVVDLENKKRKLALDECIKYLRFRAEDQVLARQFQLEIENLHSVSKSDELKTNTSTEDDQSAGKLYGS